MLRTSNGCKWLHIIIICVKQQKRLSVRHCSIAGRRHALATLTCSDYHNVEEEDIDRYELHTLICTPSQLTIWKPSYDPEAGSTTICYHCQPEPFTAAFALRSRPTTIPTFQMQDVRDLQVCAYANDKRKRKQSALVCGVVQWLRPGAREKFSFIAAAECPKIKTYHWYSAVLTRNGSTGPVGYPRQCIQRHKNATS